jgi:ketosteroid isomerase-like protein
MRGGSVPQTSAEQNLETVRALYAAYEARDVEGLLASLDDEFEVYQSELLPWGGTYKGPDGMIEFIKNITSHIDSIVVVEELVEAGDHVIMVGRSRGTITATGQPYEVRLVDVVRLREGKVLRLDIYLDTPAVLEAMGR